VSSMESMSGIGSKSGDSGLQRARPELSASVAASEEQGNSSMCSFDGFFINITEDQLNQLNEEGERNETVMNTT
jgi:hypothetical protein